MKIILHGGPSNKQTNKYSTWVSVADWFLKSLTYDLKLNTTNVSPRPDTHTKCYDFQTPTIDRGLLHPSDGYICSGFCSPKNV